jgi:hypothetical protein
MHASYAICKENNNNMTAWFLLFRNPLMGGCSDYTRYGDVEEVAACARRVTLLIVCHALTLVC